jgi:ATP-dependent Lon protease
VLPVGGIKEKVLAAHRAGLKTIILPNRNEKDLDDLPEEVRKSMKFILVDKVDKVFEAALETPPGAPGNGHADGHSKARRPASRKTAAKSGRTSKSK